MAQGLSVSRIVNVTLTLSPIAAGYRNFGATMLVVSEDFIDVGERIRSYTDVEGVLSDAGVGSPAATAAGLFFSQVPQPSLLYIGRWAQTATKGLLRGGVLTPLQQTLANFTAVTTGSMAISVDGTPRTLTGLNFSAQTNLNGVASTIQTALAAVATGATVRWDATNGRFIVTSGTTGTTSSVGYASAHTSGTDISSLLGLRSGVASVPVAGVAAETLAQAVAKLADVSSEWYAAVVATATPPDTASHLAVSALIEGMAQRRIYGVTLTDTAVLDPTRSDDFASQAKSLGYQRTFSQYSSSSPYAVASFIGRAATVNFEANNTTLTLKFKGEPGVAAERLTETQAAMLTAKNCNVYVYYQNGTAIIQEGVMANSYFFDEVQGTDWLTNAVQVDVYNLLYQSTTKVPQTDAGMNVIVNTINSTLTRAVTNGLVAPGQWNAAGFGQLAQGDTLKGGFYVYCPPIATQPQALRERRVTPSIQVAAKLAGAVHRVDVAITVNR